MNLDTESNRDTRITALDIDDPVLDIKAEKIPYLIMIPQSNDPNILTCKCELCGKKYELKKHVTKVKRHIATCRSIKVFNNKMIEIFQKSKDSGELNVNMTWEQFLTACTYVNPSKADTKCVKNNANSINNATAIRNLMPKKSK